MHKDARVRRGEGVYAYIGRDARGYINCRDPLTGGMRTFRAHEVRLACSRCATRFDLGQRSLATCAKCEKVSVSG